MIFLRSRRFFVVTVILSPLLSGCISREYQGDTGLMLIRRR